LSVIIGMALQWTLALALHSLLKNERLWFVWHSCTCYHIQAWDRYGQT